jgi:hypothetical protein
MKIGHSQVLERSVKGWIAFLNLPHMSRKNLQAFASRIFIAFIFLALSCTKDNPKPSTVPAEFTEYVNRFISEGKARGVSISSDGLTIEYVSQILINGVSYCAQSLPGTPPHVQVLQSTGCWTNRTDADKEILLFHELGHVLLGRTDNDAQLANGIYLSIMRSGDRWSMYSKFEPALRSYYLDELFNPNTPPLVVFKPKLNSKVIFNDTISASTKWLFNNYGDVVHTGNVNSAIYVSSHSSLSTQASPTVGTVNGASIWSLFITPSGISVGSELVFKIKIKMDHVTGNGLNVILRTFSGGESASFSALENVTGLVGNQDFTEYSMKLPYYPDRTDTIGIYLYFFGGSTGTVYFDDVSITNNY